MHALLQLGFLVKTLLQPTDFSVESIELTFPLLKLLVSLHDHRDSLQLSRYLLGYQHHLLLDLLLKLCLGKLCDLAQKIPLALISELSDVLQSTISCLAFYLAGPVIHQRQVELVLFLD